MRRGLAISPMFQSDADTRNQVDRTTAVGAVQDESAQLAFQISLQVREFEAEGSSLGSVGMPGHSVAQR